MTVSPLSARRRPTFCFLGELRGFAPVFIDTEIDMSRVREHRSQHGLSVVSYVLWAAARMLAAHPEANVAVRGRWRPKVARYPSADAKLALDKTIRGERVVVSAVLPRLESATLAEIQRQVEHYRDGDPETMPEFAPTRALHRLPVPLGRLLFRLGVRPLGRRARAMGTFAVTSLGHGPVDGFHSVGGTTITLGAGRIVERAVVRHGELGVAPVMRLTLTFDHRVVDGALAADLLGDLKDRLEDFAGEQPPVDAGRRAGAGR